MQDQFNPYAAPTTVTMHPRAAEWLRTQDPSLLKVGRGLGNIYLGIVIAILAVILAQFWPPSPVRRAARREGGRAQQAAYSALC